MATVPAEGQCERCLYRERTEDEQPCWECANNALYGNATGLYFVPDLPEADAK